MELNCDVQISGSVSDVSTALNAIKNAGTTLPPVVPPVDSDGNPNVGTGSITFKVVLDPDGDGLQTLPEPDGNIPEGTYMDILALSGPEFGMPARRIDLHGETELAGRIEAGVLLLGNINVAILPVGQYQFHVTVPAGYHTVGVPDQIFALAADEVRNMGFLGLIADGE